jgi:hypothetical protein
VGSALPVCWRVSSSSVSSRVPNPPGTATKPLDSFTNMSLRVKKYFIDTCLGSSWMTSLASGLERQADADADGLGRPRALHGGEHDPRTGAGDDHPAGIGQRGRHVVGLVHVHRVDRGGARADPKIVTFGMVGVAHLVAEGLVIFRSSRSGAVLAELGRRW